ncbi:MAG TPA: hypothetical protein PKH39_15710 [Woeseiaceae bacterium]|nr:hypothetical protein [Woeseiaceae bacterium]
MDVNDLEDNYPRTRRLLATLPASLVELESQSTIRSLGHLTAVVLRAEEQLLVIRLDTLEAALMGFNDTGTWGDYFPDG